MKTLLLLLILTASCMLSCSYCYAQPLGTKPTGLVTVDGFQLSIISPESDFKVGDSIPIITILTNLTKENQTFYSRSIPADYKIEVTTSNGEVIPLTRFGKQFESENVPLFGVGPLDVAPSDSYGKTFTINRIFDMTLPGTYRVKVSYYIKGEQKGAIPAVSNMVQITVR